VTTKIVDGNVRIISTVEVMSSGVSWYRKFSV